MVCLLRVLLLSCCILPLHAVGQEEPEEAAAESGQLTREERAFAPLFTLARLRKDLEESLDELRERIDDETDQDAQLELIQSVQALQAELDRIQLDFDAVATGIDVESFQLSQEESFDLKAELMKLVAPIVEELKDATEAPRQIEGMRSRIDFLTERRELTIAAISNIDTLLAASPGDELRAELVDARERWNERGEQIGRRLQIEEFQLQKRLSSRASFLDSTQNTLSRFFRTRGLNLLLAVGTFLVVLFGIRWSYRKILRLLHGRTQAERRFYARLADVLAFALAGVLAVICALAVLYATSDWVLLGLALMFLLGIAWAGKTAVPMFLEQIRLLLNFGTVRELERVVYGGIPYRVTKLSLNTMLINPELSGGVVRLPLKDLLDHRSRPCAKDEIWFPCKRGHWVLLEDGLRGKVVHQSPEMVQIELLGGSRVTFVTTDFLGLGPRNLSTGFRLSMRFGIDYAHQEISTGSVPQLMRARLKHDLEQRFGAELLLNLRVEFVEAGASSLDYAILADWDGSAAADYEAIQRATASSLVELCNEEGWVIPFTQITLHRA